MLNLIPLILKPLYLLKACQICELAARQCKLSKDTYNLGGLLIFYDLLNEVVAEGVAFDPHDFTMDP